MVYDVASPFLRLFKGALIARIWSAMLCSCSYIFQCPYECESWVELPKSLACSHVVSFWVCSALAIHFVVGSFALLVVDVWTNEKRLMYVCKSEQMVDKIWKNVEMEDDVDGEWWCCFLSIFQSGNGGFGQWRPSVYWSACQWERAPCVLYFSVCKS